MSAPSLPPPDELSTLRYLFDGDSDSKLSDVPTTTELPAFNAGHYGVESGSRPDQKIRRRRSSTSGSELLPMTKKRRVVAVNEDAGSETSQDEIIVPEIKELDSDTYGVSRFESLPGELLQKIAIYVATDQDLASLIATCRRLATAINPPDSETWKVRFLTVYDYPDISASLEYCWAYKERTFVLRNFLHCHQMDQRISIQLRVLKEMVLESYHVDSSIEPAATSLNLQAGSDPGKLKWLHTFMSSPLFNMWYHRFGEPHTLFDCLQLTFSYLLLSPAYPMAHAVKTGRDKYDIEKVYNWNKDFTTLCTLHEDQLYDGARRLTYPWRLGYQKLRGQWPIFKLDMHSLLHIRNFWHRHLLDDGHELQNTTGFGESTYSTMANGLTELGHIPRPWTARLRQWNTSSDGARMGKWIGHYSCIHGPWPKTRKDLADRESCAEDWDKVDPLTLDFDATESNIDTWPMIFGDIPAIKSTLPSQHDDSTILYLRGIAPFLDIPPLLRHKQSSSPPSAALGASNTTDPRNVRYHPYKALHLRGFMHLLACPESAYQHVGHIVDPEIPIPGFSRIFFVLYKPTSRYLVQVLEHNMGDYGNPWTIYVGQQLQSQQVTINVPNTTDGANGQEDPNVGPNSAADVVATTNVPIQAVIDGNALSHDPAQAEEILRSYLDDLLGGEHDVDVWDDGKRVLTKNKDGIWDFATKKVNNFPIDKMTRENINAMEEAYSDTKYLNWEDVEYAYGYEGIVTPGGKVMMGRWWRIGLNGVGVNDGYEVDCDGLGVSVVGGEAVAWDFNGENDEVTAATALPGEEGRRKKKSKGLERGPFVFWT